MSNRKGGRRRQRRSNPRHRKIEREERKIDGEDHISSMPDEILHHIVSFIHTDLAMKTSVLSRRWRHVWCEAPSLRIVDSRGIDRTLASSYTAPKITRLDLLTSPDSAKLDRWMEFAISREVQKLSLTIVDYSCYCKSYDFPDLLYRNSSVKQLKVELGYFEMIPRCTVSWVSVRHLSLSCCGVADESMCNILHGCPVLESLTLYKCGLQERLDLTKSSSPNLRRLDIDQQRQPSGPCEIVAPQIHYLRLHDSYNKPTTLLDVSSITQATLNIAVGHIWEWDPYILQNAVLQILAKSHNVQKLTLGPNFLQLLSLAELRGGVSFPTLKVQTLIVTTEFCQSVVPGIARLLQSSPGLKNLTLHTMMNSRHVMDSGIDRCSDSLGLNQDQCWRSKYEGFPTLKEIQSMSGCCNDEKSKRLASSMEFVVTYTKTLEKIVVCLGGLYFDDAQWYEENLQMATTFSHDNNVSVLLKRSYL